MSRDLTTLAALNATTTGGIGREVTVAGLTGTLVGVLPLAGDTYQLALIVGRARAWTDVLPGETEIELHRRRKAS